jgi:hypothetical protein
VGYVAQLLYSELIQRLDLSVDRHGRSFIEANVRVALLFATGIWNETPTFATYQRFVFCEPNGL